MKSKKIIAALVAFVMVFSLIGCSPASDSGTENTAAPAAEGTTFDDVLTVRVGTGPYPHYQSFYLAKQWGIDDMFGLDFEIQAFNNSSTGYEACVRGDIDLTYGCIAEQVAVMSGAPDIRNFAYVGYYKGFFFVGRAGEMKEWSALVDEMGLEAAVDARRNEFKGKTICIIPQKIPLVVDMLEQVGLGAGDVTFLKFADDQKGATAFMGGSGDIYIGGIPQQMQLTKSPDFINLGGYEILGPAGLWYDTMASNENFMKGNREAALRTLSCMLYVEDLFAPNKDVFAKEAATELTRLAGAEYTVEDFIKMQTVYDEYQTLDLLQSNVFNPDSPGYWINPVTYNIKTAIADGVLDDSMSVDEYSKVYFGDSEALFNEMLARKDLMDLINSASEWKGPNN